MKLHSAVGISKPRVARTCPICFFPIYLSFGGLQRHHECERIQHRRDRRDYLLISVVCFCVSIALAVVLFGGAI